MRPWRTSWGGRWPSRCPRGPSSALSEAAARLEGFARLAEARASLQPARAGAGRRRRRGRRPGLLHRGLRHGARRPSPARRRRPYDVRRRLPQVRRLAELELATQALPQDAPGDARSVRARWEALGSVSMGSAIIVDRAEAGPGGRAGSGRYKLLVGEQLTYASWYGEFSPNGSMASDGDLWRFIADCSAGRRAGSACPAAGGGRRGARPGRSRACAEQRRRSRSLRGRLAVA